MRWAALTIWMAEHYPEARITALSNSSPQRENIQSVCSEKGITNVRVVTADIKDFFTDLSPKTR